MSTTTKRATIVAVLALALAALTAVGAPTAASGQAPTEDDGVVPIQALTVPPGYEPLHAETGQVLTHAGFAGTLDESAITPSDESTPGSETVGGESVIGPDGRVQITDTSLNASGFPARAIGQIEFIDFDGGSFICTGWLIDSNTILSAGHCAFTPDPSGNHHIQSAQFYPGRLDGSPPNNPYGVCNVLTVFAPTLWTINGSEYNDWSLMNLSCNVGNTVGYLGYFSVAGQTALLHKPARVAGYPGDQEFGTPWGMTDRIEASQKKMVFYDIDTAGGQSGSPVYQPSRPSCQHAGSNTSPGPCAMAIHAYGNAHGSGPHFAFNHAPRITVPRFGLIADLADNNGG